MTRTATWTMLCVRALMRATWEPTNMLTYEWIGHDIANRRTFDRTDKAKNEECLRVMLRRIYGSGLIVTTVRVFDDNEQNVCPDCGRTINTI